MHKLLSFIRQHHVSILLCAILLFAFVIRLHNIRVYTTWWADDGGGHVMYVESLLHHERLPSMNENYLSWHEPGYYALINIWTHIVRAFDVGDQQLNWQETTSVVISLFSLYLVWRIAITLTQNKWVSLATVFFTSVLFVSVKLAGYLNNELPAQTAILGLAYLFHREKLLDAGKDKQVAYFAILLAFALLLKLTVILVLFAAIFIWLLFGLVQKKMYVFRYILISIFIATALHTPWLVYKQREFGSAFTINLYEDHKQSLLTSDAWSYLFRFNHHFVTDYPYWFKGPHSFATILIADTFSDYYNLFHHWDNARVSPDRILVMNGLHTVPELWRTTLWTNRLGLYLTVMLMIGFLWQLRHDFLKKNRDWYQSFWYVLILGGYAALVYNNLRHPYLERGVLKALFIYYVFPLTILFGYSGWWRLLKHKWLWILLCLLPVFVYTWLGWPILYMRAQF